LIRAAHALSFHKLEAFCISGGTAMNIGTAARAAGLPTKTIRYYADIGLVAPQARAENGYRAYGPSEVQRLQFVRRARAFGFSVEECRELLGLYADRDRASADVKRLALQRIERIQAQMAELEALRDDLARLADACKGDGKPDCPILNGLAGTDAR
jgi:Cu(I)-responsive transcriptional regulator